tara:strand:+ start:277 stop:1848 length:1572 start_codon:yes stop_codon:yes gene_type:complete
VAINRTTTSVQRGIEEPEEFEPQFIPGVKSKPGTKWKPAELKFGSPGFHDRMSDPSFRAALETMPMTPGPSPASSPSPSYGTTAFREGGRSPSGGRGMTPIPTSFKPTVMPPGVAGVKTSTMSGPTVSTYKSPFEIGAFAPETLEPEAFEPEGFEPAESHTPKTYGPGFDYLDDDPDESYTSSYLDKLRGMRRAAGDPLWGIEGVSRYVGGRPRSVGVTKGVSDHDGGPYSRYYVPRYDTIAKEFEKPGDERPFGWGHLVTGARSVSLGDSRGLSVPTSDIPAGMTPEEFSDLYMSGVTGVLPSGRKWYGDPADYVAGKIGIEPAHYDPETGTFVRPTGVRKPGKFFRTGVDPATTTTHTGAKWTPVEGEEDMYETPHPVYKDRHLDDLELGRFVSRRDDDFSSVWRDSGPYSGDERHVDYAFSPESGTHRYPGGVAPRMDDETRGDKLRAFYGDEVYDKLRHSSGLRWSTDSELKRRAKEEGWSPGGKIKHGKFVPHGGYMDSKGRVFDINGMPYVPSMEPI